MSSDILKLTIEEVADSGEPLAPIKNFRKIINQARVIVRDMLPITIIDWHKPKDANN